MNHFVEIAKMRAARMLWAKIVKQLIRRIQNRWHCVRIAKLQVGA